MKHLLAVLVVVPFLSVSLGFTSCRDELESPLSVLASGVVDLAGSWTGFLRFFRRLL